ncbi:MAG: DUF6022 family protein, partial [Chloroflexota bacterium]
SIFDFLSFTFFRLDPIALEWGPETERQRWMWSIIYVMREKAIGSIVIKFFHDHTQFRIHQLPGIIVLEAADTDQIVESLSHLSEEFRHAEM